MAAMCLAWKPELGDSRLPLLFLLSLLCYLSVSLSDICVYTARQHRENNQIGQVCKQLKTTRIADYC